MNKRISERGIDYRKKLKWKFIRITRGICCDRMVSRVLSYLQELQARDFKQKEPKQ